MWLVVWCCWNIKSQAGSGGGEVGGDVMEDLGRHVKECVIFPLCFSSQPGHCDGRSFSWSVRPRTALQNSGKFQTLKWITEAFIPIVIVYFSSVQFSCSVVSNSLQPHEPQHARPPCLSPTPGVYPNSCPMSLWCHLTTSSSNVPFSSCLQSFSTSGSFQMSQLFASGGQNTGVSASTSVLPMNTQDWFPLGWTDWISLQSKGLSRIFSNTTVQEHQFFCALGLLYSPE